MPLKYKVIENGKLLELWEMAFTNDPLSERKKIRLLMTLSEEEARIVALLLLEKCHYTGIH